MSPRRDRAAAFYGEAVRNRTRVVSPARLRRRVRPAEPWEDWDAAETALLADPDHRRRICELAEDIRANGFQRPVTVGRDRPWQRRPRVRDGMHRALAAVHAGQPIPIRFGQPHADGYGDFDVYLVRVGGGHPVTAGLAERVLALASFRSGDGFWLRADAARADPAGEVELLLPSRPPRRAAIAAELSARLDAAGLAATVTCAGHA